MRLLPTLVLAMDMVAGAALALAALLLTVPYGLVDNIPEALALRAFGLLFELALLALCSARVLQIAACLRQAPTLRRLRAATASATIGESGALGS